MTTPSNPVATKVKELAQPQEEIKTLSTGVRVIVDGISSFELSDITSSIQDPKPPMVKDPETGREFENVDDPHYQADLQAAHMKRGLFVLDAMLIGTRLVDGMPEDESWVARLLFKVKRGLINLDGLSFDNPFEKEYLFKKYEAFKTTDDWQVLSAKAEEVRGGIRKADKMFPDDPERSADSGTPTEEGSSGS